MAEIAEALQVFYLHCHAERWEQPLPAGVASQLRAELHDRGRDDSAPRASVDELIAHGVGSDFGVATHAHLFEDASPIRAHGLHA